MAAAPASSTVLLQRQLRKAEKHLQRVCPRIGAWIQTQGKCAWEPQFQREPFEALVRAIAHQQLHGKAAESILRRLIERFPGQAFPTPQQLTRMRIASYRACGFSLAKAEAIRGIGRGSLQGTVPDLATAAQMDDEQLIALLTQLRGIGKWTVEMFLIFTLGRMDVMPADDYGIRAGLAHLYGLDAMPKKVEIASITDAWRPYRSVGAWYLWRAADSLKP
jgi:DNA-3-methyladenine glycosylase II